MKKITIFLLGIFLTFPMLSKAESSCSPIFKGNINNSKITLNCTRDIAVGAIKKLERTLNKKWALESNGDCNFIVHGDVNHSNIRARCGFSSKNIKELVDDFIKSYQDLKKQVINLSAPSADTKILQQEANEAVNNGNFNEARELIDKIIKRQNSVSLEILNNLSKIDDFKKTQLINLEITLLAKAEANAANGNIMYLEGDYGSSIKYLSSSISTIDFLKKHTSKNYTSYLIDYMHQIANSYSIGRYERTGEDIENYGIKAKNYYKKALNMAESTLRNDHLKIARILSDMKKDHLMHIHPEIPNCMKQIKHRHLNGIKSHSHRFSCARKIKETVNNQTTNNHEVIKISADMFEDIELIGGISTINSVNHKDSEYKNSQRSDFELAIHDAEEKLNRPHDGIVQEEELDKFIDNVMKILD